MLIERGKRQGEHRGLWRVAAYGLAVLLLAVLAALWLGPQFVDWSRYKATFAERMSEALGRPVTVQGSLDLVLLPSPRLSLSDVRVANHPEATADQLLTVRSVDATLELGALITGRIELSELILVEPVLELERFDDGGANWQLARTQKSGTDPEGTEPSGASDALYPERLTIENGTLIYRDPRIAGAQRIARIEAQASTFERSGAIRGSGRFAIGRATFDFDLSKGRTAKDRSASFALTLALVGSDSTAGFEAMVRVLEDGIAIDGTLRLEGTGIGETMGAMGLAPPTGGAILHEAYRLEGRLSTGSGDLRVDGLRLQLGEFTGEGALAIRFEGRAPFVDIKIDLGRFDLDAVLEAAGGPRTESPAGESDEQSSQGARVEVPLLAIEPGAIGDTLIGVLPDDLSASLDLSVGVLVFRQGVIRQVVLVAALDDGVVTIQQGSALLPGGADLAVFGQVDIAPDAWAYAGRVEGMADDFRAVLGWLGVDLSDVPSDRLRVFSLGCWVEANEYGVALNDIDLRLDATRLSGDGSVAFADRTVIWAELEIDRLNFDAYFPEAADSNGSAGEDVFIPIESDPIPALEGVSSSINVHLRTLIRGGRSLRDIDLTARLKGGAFLVEQASGAVQGKTR
ncbi:MAG: AsmA family protein [Proteobacteria bacterium]|nr:AsmA family protein [Pseudomonadota bacterium]